MNQMNKMMFTAIGILIVTLTNGVQAQMPEIPANLKQMVGQALQASETAMAGEQKQRAAAQQEYEATMTQIADTVDPKLAEELKAYEGESIEAKVITIADYKKKNPALHENVIESYFTRYVNKESIHQFGRAPDVKSVFKEEDYRLVWEYYALACNLENRPSLADRRPIEALRIIGNPKSLITLEVVLKHIYENEPRDRNKVEGRIAELLSAISSVGGSTTLDTMLGALRELKADKYFEMEYSERNVYDSVFNIFAMMPKDRLAEWKQAMESYPKDQLNAQEQKLFERSLATQGH